MKLPLKEYIRRATVGDIIQYSRVHGYLRVQRIVHYMGRIECVSAKYWSSDGISKIYHIGMDNGGDVVVIHQPAAELCKCDHCTGGKSAYDKAEAWNKEANEEVNKANSVVVVEFRNEKPQKPLGDDFNMRYYLDVLKSCVHYYPGTSRVIQTGLKRLNALIKIWEWKEKHDGKFGVEEVMEAGTPKYFIYYQLEDKKLKIDVWCYCVFQTELPLFSSLKIADSALKELEQEYKIVFNVK